jgi:hypothetical protein
VKDMVPGVEEVAIKLLSRISRLETMTSVRVEGRIVGEKDTLPKHGIAQYLCDPISSAPHYSQAGFRIAS